jgi:tetratricopeptide (TPR) repeat protein
MTVEAHIREYRRVKRLRVAASIVVAAILAAGCLAYGSYTRGEWLVQAPITDLQAAAKQTPDDEQLVYGLASRIISDGRGEEAYPMLRELVRKHPENARYWGHFAYASSMLGHVSETADAYRRTIALSPRAADAHMALGSIYVRAGMPEIGSSEIETAFRLNPNATCDGELWARCLISQGRDAEAWAFLLKSFNAQPTFDVLYEPFTDLGIRLGKKDEVEKWLRRRIEISPMYDIPEPRAALATLMLTEDDDPLALPEAEALARMAVSKLHPEYYAILAKTLLKKGDDAGARRALEIGVKLKSDCAPCIALLAPMLQKHGDVARAAELRARIAPKAESAQIRSLREAISAGPDVPAARIELAGALGVAGRPAPAAEQCFEAVRISPGNAQAATMLEQYRDAAVHTLDGARDAKPNTLLLPH